ncbi:fatty acid 2-hydroxylase-like [Patiria miniata]|uniref:Fatty acid 2-hydroxylase n=1 Tax=Patiria miniata TaxID=46514 RepID=A0A914ATQ4_PATMI|nr:fatty acid 2-hydroxylase-like [Patiria miniata]
MGRTISTKELEEWKGAGRVCLVREGRVFDVTDFVGMHPGGEKPLKNNAGRDVTTLMTRPNPHRHSSNAYKLLEAYYVGELENGVASNGVTSNHTVSNDQPTQLNGNMTNGSSSHVKDLVDYSKPVLWQVVNLGDKYYSWTHQPISRDSLRLFHYDLLEYFSTSSWYAVPITWIPFISIVCWLAIQQWQDVSMFSSVFGGAFEMPVTCGAFPLVFFAGALLWTFVEYILHRFLFHMEPPTNSKLLIGLHFVLHGQHHKVPFHPGRLVFPPVAASVFVVLFYFILTAALPVPIAYTLMAGVIFGYICYDLTHYYLHHGSPAQGTYFQALKSYHVRHHYEIQDKGFGISSKLWDIVFDTLIPSVKAE